MLLFAIREELFICNRVWVHIKLLCLAIIVFGGYPQLTKMGFRIKYSAHPLVVQIPRSYNVIFNVLHFIRDNIVCFGQKINSRE